MLRKELGNLGEEVARKFLKRKKFTILEQNYRTKIGEIDLIVKDRNTIVFVEVRSKSNCLHGHPMETIDEHKQRKIRRTAELYLISKGLSDCYCRFDIVTVVWQDDDWTVEYLPDAF